MLGAAPESFPIFQWHDDTFTLPEGAVRLAGKRRSPRTRRSASAAPPTASSSISRPTARWCGNGTLPSRDIAERQPDWRERFENEAARHGPVADAAGLALARAWVATI